jgi:hypothetical protein
MLRDFSERGLLKVGSLKTALEFALTSGRDTLSEPTFSGVLHTLQLNAWQGLKRRARVLIPDSGTLIGCSDSTGILQPNEVFV